MAIELKWHNHITLQDGDSDNLIFRMPKIENNFDFYGVYMFCRIFGKGLIPLYIGKSDNVGQRLEQHLKHNVKLMKSIEKATNGKKVVVVGEFIPKQGQDKSKTIMSIEKHLIEAAQAKGCELFNIKGAKYPTDIIQCFGYQKAKNLFGKNIRFRK